MSRDQIVCGRRGVGMDCCGPVRAGTLGIMIKRVVTAMLSLIGASSIAEASVVSPEVFTGEFASAVREALPTHAVTVTEPLRLQLTRPDGVEASAYLGNAYQEYLQDPTAKAAIVARHVAALIETAAGPKRLDPQRIVPVIKDVGWLQDMQRAAQGSEQVSDDVNGDLVVVYAEDTPTNTLYFSVEQLKEAGIRPQELRSLAIANLRRILPPVETHSGRLVSMLTAGGDYVASLLLLDELWNGTTLAADGEFVVAVPSRDVLLFTGTRNAQGVARLRELARKTAAESPYSLTDQLFVYRDGQFVRYVP